MVDIEPVEELQVVSLHDIKENLRGNGLGTTRPTSVCSTGFKGTF